MSRVRTISAFACGLAVCLGWASSSEQKTRVEKPVFLVSYCHEVTDPYQSLELAVWRNGRVIWRVGKTGRVPHDTDTWLKGKYYEGQIPPQRVRAALSQFRRKKLLDQFDSSTLYWPTSSPRRLEINDGAKRSSLGLQSKESVSLRAQKLLKKVTPSLMPKTRREIPPPDSSKWW